MIVSDILELTIVDGWLLSKLAIDDIVVDDSGITVCSVLYYIGVLGKKIQFSRLC